MPLRLEAKEARFGDALAAHLAARAAESAEVEGTVDEIIGAVRACGDAALIEYTERFDGVSLEPDGLRFSQAERDHAAGLCGGGERIALERAAERIEAYHRRQIPEDTDYTDEDGIRLGARWTPLDSVGLYVPGGQAAYPSSVLMNAVPAKVAGVQRIVMAVPCPKGEVNPLVLAAAEIAGVSEIYRIGGAQAIAAMAYGTESLAATDKIVGPGNAYVAAAKRRVFGAVGIDLVAGPSEVLVVADDTVDPDWVALDLLAQAEHDADAQSILLTDDGDFADRVCAAVECRLKDLPRAGVAGDSWERHGAVIVVESMAQAPDIIDRVAPEHLQIAITEPEGIAGAVRHAGAIFLGRYTPEAVGDYVAGPNHVLPTSGSARFSSGLGVLDFMKRSSIVSCDRDGLQRIGPTAVSLAEAEGLSAHALSVRARLEN